MRTAKFTQLITVLMLTLLLLATCSRTTTPQTTDENAPPPPTAAYDTEQTVQDLPPGGIHQPRDLGNTIITVGVLWEGDVPFTMLPPAHNEPDPATSRNYTRDRMIWNNARRVEREFNVTLQEVVASGPVRLANQLRTSVLAGEAFVDIMFAAPDILLPAALNNLLLPLDTIDLPGSDLLGMQLFSHFVAEGFGHAWAFSTAEPRTANVFTLGVNLDIINAAGAPNPVALYYNGQWTWDAMLEIMRMTTIDTTGGTETNQWGILGRPSELLRNFIAANDGILVTDDLNFGLDHPNSIEAIAFVETIFREGLWKPNVQVQSHGGAGWSSTPYISAIQDGDAAFIAGWQWFSDRFIADVPIEFEFSSQAELDRAPIAPLIPFEFAVVPLPTGPSNTSGNTWGGGWQSGLAFPQASNQDAAHLLMVMEEYFSWAVNEPERLYDIPITWGNGVRLTDGNAVRQLNALTQMHFDIGNSVAEFERIFDRIAENFMPLFDEWNAGYTTLQAVNAHRDQMQRELDNFFR